MKNKSYEVKLKNSNNSFFFTSNRFLKINTTVIIKTNSGLQFGRIIAVLEEERHIDCEFVRVSSKKDYDLYLKILKENEEAYTYSQEIANELNLGMRMLNADFTFDKKQLLINFVADDRVDFRELAKKLASKYRTRIELRQIGARDRAKDIGGIGSCGRKLCCSTFLNHIDAISINMAKNQGISLNPNKINGVCGRLLCCLTYEDEEYTNCKKNLPKVGDQIIYNGEEGKVVFLDILNKKGKILIGNDIKEVNWNENRKE